MLRGYGNQLGTIRTHRSAPAGAAGQRQHSQLAGANAIIYVAEHGGKWRGLPPRFGKWHTAYTRMNRWSKNGALDRVFAALQEKGILQVRLEVVALDSASVKVHPDGTGAPRKRGCKALASPVAAGTPSCIWLPRMSGGQ